MLGAAAAGPALAGAPTTAQVAERRVGLDELLRLEGDQVVIVPDGTYQGVQVRAERPETDGPLGGWLVLQAENRNGAVITGDLRLESPTSRILFVGFRFENARVFNHGQHLAYWYTDHVYPDVSWYAEDRPIPRQFFARFPATDVAVLGSDFHDGVASPVNVSGVDRMSLTGVRIYDLTEPPGSDPEDLSHLNTISLLGGDVTDLVVSRSSLVGARANHQTDQGDVVGLRYEDVWYRGAFGSAFQFNATNGYRIIDGERVRVRSWGHVGDQPQDRLDIVAGEQLEPSARPSQVDVRDIDVQLERPPPDAVDPARAWRDENPYRSWWRYFGWTRIDPISAQDAVPEPVEPVAAPEPRLADEESSSNGVDPVTAAVGGVLVVGGGAYLLRRRRRRSAPA